MKKIAILRALGIAISLSLLALGFISSEMSLTNWQIKSHEITFEYPENQRLINESLVAQEVHQFLANQDDSGAFHIDMHLLETSLNALPYVDEAQVYWNLNNTMVVELRATQAKAKVFMEQSKHLLTQGGALLPAPRNTQIDLPILTGIEDSAAAIAALPMLDKIINAPCFNNMSIAQVHISNDAVEIIPRVAKHSISANADKRLETDLNKIAAFYAATPKEELDRIQHLDARYKNQVVSTKQ